jgi:eukaryotic-like serine/threonine-protein kinase
MSEEAEILAIASQRVGTVLHGKYHIDGVLGVGGMATVYAATHRNRKRFAVKMLHTEFAVRSDVRARFVREGYVANSVPHPGVVAVIDDDVDELGSPFLVMELLEGVTVDVLYTTGDGAIPVREALGIAHQLLDVLEAAHQKSVVHRDIKPANLFVLRDGQLKVLDFGIARLRDADVVLKSTRAGALLGTPAFMAPELALGMPENVDARTDVWAVGATLFTMLSACLVHSGGNARQIMIRAATEPARSLESIMPDLPVAVAALVSRALAFDRGQRWPSAAAMRDAVLETYRDLFGSEPVRSDVAALVQRTSATVGTQPTQPHPFTVPHEPGRRSSGLTPKPHSADLRALQDTASTPVSTLRPVATRKTRWLPLALLSGAAVLATGALIARGQRVARTPVSAPTAAVNTAEVPRAAVAPSQPSTTTPAATLPVSPAAASGDVVPEAHPQPTKPARVAASTRKAPRLVPSATAAAASAAPVSASPRPENPLKLELQ